MVRKTKKLKILKGGDENNNNNGEGSGTGNNMINWDMNKMSLYYATVIMGYFGCKIFMGFYKIYSRKVPSRELEDFNTIIILSLLTYIFTGMNHRQVLGKDKVTNALFFFGYIIGLNYPAVKYKVDGLNNEGETFRGLSVFFYTIIVSLVIMILFFGSKSTGITTPRYILFVVIIALIVWGLVYTRKMSKIYTDIQIQQDHSRTHKRIKTAGMIPDMDASVFSWLLTLIFMYDSSNIAVQKVLLLLNGIIFGVFVSSISMDGIRYILATSSQIECAVGSEECEDGGLSVGTVTEEDKVLEIQNTIKSNMTTLQWLIGIIITIMILIIILYFFSHGGE